MNANRFLYFCLLMICFLQYVSGQETFPVNGVYNKNHNFYALTNARIIRDEKSVIEKGTLLIKDGIITDVGEKITIPSGTVVIDLKGNSIYPSLIDAYTGYGIPEVRKIPKSTIPQYESSTKGAYDWNQAIKPEFNAVSVFSIDKKAAEEFRKLGFGTVLVLQKDGIARGTAAVVTLNETRDNEVVLADKAAACYSFDKGSSNQEYPTSLMGSIALLRQTYLDGQWYQSNQKKTEYNASLVAWNSLRKLPAIFEVKDKLSVNRAAKIAREFGEKYILKCAGDAYQRIDDMKQSGCRFILPLNFPMAYDVEDPYDALNVSLQEMKHWEMAPANPAFFEKNFIEFALTSSDLKDKSDFWKNLRKAIDYGLSEKQALRSLTEIPAEMLGIQDKVGKINKGMLANFIVTSGNLFEAKTKILQNWVQGNQYIINDFDLPDLKGTYELKVGTDKVYKLKISGDPEHLIANLQNAAATDTNKISATLKLDNYTVLLNYVPSSQKESVRLSGLADEKRNISGRGELSSGEWIDWIATFKAEPEEKTKRDTVKKIKPLVGEIYYPFCAYGEPRGNKSLWKLYKERQHAILIKNVTVWTNDTMGILRNKDVYINEGRIVRIDNSITPEKNAFAVEMDGTGKHLTAGIIDEHSHIAISGDVNEASHALTSEVRIGDVIDCEDINIYRQLASGVTACQLLHGSANPIGGQSALIKLRWGESADAMKIENADGFIKFALGENVKQSNWGDTYTSRFPQTRMGVEQVYYDAFTRAKEYQERLKAYNGLSKKEKSEKAAPRRNLQLEALVEILNKQRFITCHSYVQSELNMLMHVSDSMGFSINTFTHILEGYKVADKMKTRGIGASTFSDWWAYKMEVRDAIPYNAALLSKMGIVTAVNSDDAEMARRLNQEAAKAIKYGGLTEEEALKLCTLNPAKLLHLDKKLGRVVAGNDADLVLWSDNPLSVNAKAEKTIIDGLVYYDRDKDLKMREEIQKERARLIQKMIGAKKAGEKTQKPEVLQELNRDYE